MSLREEREGRKQIASLFEGKEFFALWYAKIAFWCFSTPNTNALKFR